MEGGVGPGPTMGEEPVTETCTADHALFASFSFAALTASPDSCIDEAGEMAGSESHCRRVSSRHAVSGGLSSPEMAGQELLE